MNPIRTSHPRLASTLPLLLTLPFLTFHSNGATAPSHSNRPATPAREPMKTVRMKTIGVIGGIGPQATMDFEARIHRVSQRRIAPRFNSSYPPLVVYFHRRAPLVVDQEGMPILPIRVDPELLKAVAAIGPMVDFLVITSNGAHRFAEDIERASGRPVLSMVDRVVEEVERRKWRRVGLMTLGRPTIYSEPLERKGIAFEALSDQDQSAIDRAIFAVMEGREDDASKRVAREAVENLRRRGVDGVILGCTELPFLVEPGGEADLIHPIELLAEAAVEHATRTDASAGLTP